MPTLRPGLLKVVTYSGFAPVSWIACEKPAGYDLVFLRSFAETQGLELVVRHAPFDGIWTWPAQDRADIAAAGIAPLPERSTAGMIWSDPYYQVQRSLIIRRRDAERLRTIDDFASRTIAVTHGSTAEIDLLSRKRASTVLVPIKDQDQAVEALLSGQIDAYGTGDICSHFIAQRYPGLINVIDIHPMQPIETFAFAIRAASDLHQALNQFIANHATSYGVEAVTQA